jgi:hypothetical protein
MEGRTAVMPSDANGTSNPKNCQRMTLRQGATSGIGTQRGLVAPLRRLGGYPTIRFPDVTAFVREPEATPWTGGRGTPICAMVGMALAMAPAKSRLHHPKRGPYGAARETQRSRLDRSPTATCRRVRLMPLHGHAAHVKPLLDACLDRVRRGSRRDSDIRRDLAIDSSDVPTYASVGAKCPRTARSATGSPILTRRGATVPSRHVRAAAHYGFKGLRSCRFAALPDSPRSTGRDCSA